MIMEIIRKIAANLFSAYFWFVIFFIAFLFFPFALLIWCATIAYDRRLVALHMFTCFWSDFSLMLNPLWKIRVIGRKKILPRTVYIITSNHQSGADIMVLYKLYRKFKWVAKKSLFRVPFIGWNMALNRYLSLERTSNSSMRKMLRDASLLIAKGNSLMIFPEGTRSRDGQVQPFKTGAFLIALETKTPIVPIAISGTAKAIDRGGFLILRNKNIRATVLDPIPYESFKEMDAKEIAVMVRDRIRASLENEQEAFQPITPVKPQAESPGL